MNITKYYAVRAAGARAPHPRAAEAEDAETRVGGLQARHPRHRGHRGEGAAVLLAHVDNTQSKALL